MFLKEKGSLRATKIEDYDNIYIIYICNFGTYGMKMVCNRSNRRIYGMEFITENIHFWYYFRAFIADICRRYILPNFCEAI